MGGRRVGCSFPSSGDNGGCVKSFLSRVVPRGTGWKWKE